MLDLIYQIDYYFLWAKFQLIDFFFLVENCLNEVIFALVFLQDIEIIRDSLCNFVDWYNWIIHLIMYLIDALPKFFKQLISYSLWKLHNILHLLLRPSGGNLNLLVYPITDLLRWVMLFPEEVFNNSCNVFFPSLDFIELFFQERIWFSKEILILYGLVKWAKEDISSFLEVKCLFDRFYVKLPHVCEQNPLHNFSIIKE